MSGANKLKTGVCPFMKAPMANCYCRSLSSENIEKAYDFCSGAFEDCSIYQNVFRADDVIHDQVSQQDHFPVIGLATGQERGYQLLSRQALTLKILNLLGNNSSARSMYRDFVLLLRNFSAVKDITLYVLDGDNHLWQEIVSCQGAEVFEERIPGKLDCLCGRILEEEVIDATLKTTGSGVYWTNDRSGLSPTATQGLQACINNRFPDQVEGSLALLPVKCLGKAVGVLRINDERKELFTFDDMQYLEGVCQALGLIVERARADRSRAYAEMIVDIVQSPIAVIDAKGVYRKVNHGFERFLSRPSAEIVGKSISDVADLSAFEDVLKPVLELALCGERAKKQCLFENPGREAARFDLTCDPYFDSEGSVDAVVVCLHEVLEG